MPLGVRVPRHQGVRVPHQVVEHHVPGPGFEFDAPYARQAADLLLALLRHDRALHALHMIIGLGIMAVMLVVVVARHDHRRILQPDRDQRPLLALRRHRLDFPVSAALSDRAARALKLKREREPIAETCERIVPKRTYFTIFAHPACSARTSPWQIAYLRPRCPQHRRRAGDRGLQGDAGRALLHAREIQHAADLGRRRSAACSGSASCSR